MRLPGRTSRLSRSMKLKRAHIELGIEQRRDVRRENLVARWKRYKDRENALHLSGSARQDRLASKEDIEKFRRMGWE